MRELLAATDGAYPHIYGSGWDGVLPSRGFVDDKIAAMSRYSFCLCFENCRTRGYVTEKLPDCLYAGTIPLYLGAPDVADFVPEDCYVDASAYPSYRSLWQAVCEIDSDVIARQRYVDAMDRFLVSERFARTFSSVAFAERLVEAVNRAASS